MKVEELRIGNIVRITADIANQFYGGLLPIRQPTYDIIISGISDESIFYGKPDRIWNKAEVNIKDIYPIPLTSDILIKNNILHLGYNVTEVNGEWILEGLNVRIKYVHQLQNLFYVLMGEELDVRL